MSMDDKFGALSESQLLCLRLAADGLTSKEIAIETGFTYQTVDQYLSKAAATLGVPNRKAAARLLKMSQMQFSQAEFSSNALSQSSAKGNQEPMAAEFSQASADGKWLLRLFALLRIPPIGGTADELSMGEMILVMGRMALVTLIMIVAAVITIIGLMQLLG